MNRQILVKTLPFPKFTRKVVNAKTNVILRIPVKQILIIRNSPGGSLWHILNVKIDRNMSLVVLHYTFTQEAKVHPLVYSLG